LVILGLSILYLSSTTTKIECDASWVKSYNSIPDLLDHSDAVVMGKIIESNAYIEENGLVFTDYLIQVEKSLKGETEKEILVHQTGGKIDNKIIEIGDDPLFNKEHNMVLFLKEYEKNKYYVLGGPQGRFIIENGKLYSIGEIDERSATTTKPLHTNGIELDTFLKLN